ncbi:MAG: DUF3122 domain-containing protein [Hormoscilla sp.]
MRILSRLLLLCLCLVLLYGGLGSLTTQEAAANVLMPRETIASIRTIEEAPGQMLYQSRHSWRDRAGNSWQVILFKRVKAGQIASVSLRLVGFPGLAKIAHPQPLLITTKKGKEFTSPDMFAEKSPAPNVGQYDLSDVLLKLPSPGRVMLHIPLIDNESITLRLPPSAVLEWQAIANY